MWLEIEVATDSKPPRMSSKPDGKECLLNNGILVILPCSTSVNDLSV